MNTRNLVTTANTAGSRVKSDLLDPPEIDNTFLGTNFLYELFDGGYTLLIILCGLAFFVGVGLMIFGKIGSHSVAFTAGWITLACAIVGAGLSTSVNLFINWGAERDLAS